MPDEPGQPSDLSPVLWNPFWCITAVHRLVLPNPFSTKRVVVAVYVHCHTGTVVPADIYMHARPASQLSGELEVERKRCVLKREIDFLWSPCVMLV